MDLIYTIYIGRYTKELLGVEPDFSKLDCTEINGRLGTSQFKDFYIYACQQGWINHTLQFTQDLNIDEEITQKMLRQVYLPSAQTYGILRTYTLQDLDHDSKVRVSQLQTFYTNIIAYLVVSRFSGLQRGVDKELWIRPLINLDYRLFTIRFNFSTVLHIKDYQEVKDTVELPIERFIGDNEHYYTYDNWVFDNLEKDNFRTKGYTYPEKHQHLLDSKYYQVGLPIFKYEKAVNLTAGNIAGLKQVHLCVIKEVGPRSITLNTTSITGTNEDLDYIKEQNNHLDEIFSLDNGLGAVNQRVENLDYSFIGIDTCMMGTMRLWGKTDKERKENFLDEMFEEKYFIRGVGDQLQTDLFITRPEFPQVYTPGHKYFKVTMTYADAVFWLLDDHKVLFDRELFKQVYKGYLAYDKPLAEMTTEELIQTLLNSEVEQNIQTGKGMDAQYQAYLLAL